MRNSSEKLFYILGEGFAKGTVFLVFYVFSNYLSKTSFGKLSLYWAAIPVFSLLLDLAQRSYVKIYYIENKEHIYSLLKNIYLFSIGTFILLLIVQKLLSFFDIYLIDEKFDVYLIWSSFFFVLIELYLSYLQIKGKVLRYSFIYIIRSSITYIITALIFLFWLVDIKIYPIIYLITSGITALFLFQLVWKKGKSIKLSSFKKSIFDSLIFSSPLIIGINLFLYSTGDPSP